MTGIREAIVAQFGKPSGIWGAIAGEIMAHRPSNRERAFRILDLLEMSRVTAFSRSASDRASPSRAPRSSPRRTSLPASITRK